MVRRCALTDGRGDRFPHLIFAAVQINIRLSADLTIIHHREQKGHSMVGLV